MSKVGCRKKRAALIRRGNKVHRRRMLSARVREVHFVHSVLYPVQSTTLNAMIPSGQRATLISINSMVFPSEGY